MAVALTIDNDLHDQLALAAAEADISLRAALRDAVVEYIDRANARASFHQEALDSLAAFEKTGLHLTGAEMQSWLDSWRPGQPVPPCHG